MKFLPEEKKKRIWSIGILLLAVVGTIYVNFFMGETGRKGSSPLEVLKPVPAGKPGGSSPFPPLTKKPAGERLPYGTTLDLRVLEQSNFKALKLPPPLKVASQELGKADLFSR